ncbi:hypothetical protein ACFSTE_17505 [Aquimarina hainanensis]|uniref:Right handed beta helix domain-containing protein n=1 Tax=Aquimarina hainanensis TaxID=1578017 RepID=A0ABW5NCR8_9FLAO
MKTTKTYSLILCCCFFFLACSSDNEVIEDPVVVPPPGVEEPISDAPCKFNLNGDLPVNGVMVIDCILDLDGKTIELPENFKFDFDGGIITNGTLKFNGGYIDGRLLNSKLKIEGSTKLKNPAYQFLPSRWEIVQGKTTQENALRNKKILEDNFEMAQALKAESFSIGAMDAYFYIAEEYVEGNYYPTLEAINVPSNFTLIMSNDTHIRTFPNSSSKYSLLAVHDAENITIKGGNLYGDRDEHNYAGGGTHEWGHVLALRSAVNVVIDGVRAVNGAGDGIDINSIGFTHTPEGYKPSNNIIIKNCILDSNRRNNLTVSDGRDIRIENNQFLNASINTAHSTGIAPGFGIDIEAERERGDDGELIYDEMARDIQIVNNIERGGRKGAFLVFIGYDILIEGNQTENSIGYSFGNGIKIRKNKITAVGSDKTEGTAILAGRTANSETIYNNDISENEIIGYNVGINVKNRDTKVYKNVITDFTTAIFPSQLENSEIYSNTLNSSRKDSRGIFVFMTSVNNITLRDNDITVTSNPIKFASVNLEPEAQNWKVTVTKNTTRSPVHNLITMSHNIDVIDNHFFQSFEIYDSKSIELSKNRIDTNRDGIHLKNTNLSIGIKDNHINIDPTKECIIVQSTTNDGEVLISNNTCVQ